MCNVSLAKGTSVIITANNRRSVSAAVSAVHFLPLLRCCFNTEFVKFFSNISSGCLVSGGFAL